MTEIYWMLGGVIVALSLVVLIVWLGRDRKMMRVRFGFFLERDPFPHDQWPDPSARTEILWPGERPSDRPSTIPRKED